MGEGGDYRLNRKVSVSVLKEEERMLTDSEIESLTYFAKRRAMQTNSFIAIISRSVSDLFHGSLPLMILTILVIMFALFVKMKFGLARFSFDFVIGGAYLLVFVVLIAHYYDQAQKQRAASNAQLKNYQDSLRGPHLVWECRPVHAYKLVAETVVGNRQVDNVSRFLFDMGGNFLYVPSEALAELLIWGGVDGAMVDHDTQSKAARYFPSEEFRYFRWKSDGSPIGFVCGSRVVSPSSLYVHPEVVQRLGQNVKLIQRGDLEALKAFT